MADHFVPPSDAVLDFHYSLTHDHPDERVPFHWKGPAELTNDTLNSRLFIGRGYHPCSADADNSEPGTKAALELVLLVTGTNTTYPGEFIQAWVC